MYEKGKYIGNTSVTQLSIGFQAGGQAYSQIVFFEDKRALDEFTNGNFEFEAGVSAVAITAAAGGIPGEISWNFEKFLIGRDGRVLRRYPPETKPRDNGLMQDIAEAL